MYVSEAASTLCPFVILHRSSSSSGPERLGGADCEMCSGEWPIPVVARRVFFQLLRIDWGGLPGAEYKLGE